MPRRSMSSALLALASIRATTRRPLSRIWPRSGFLGKAAQHLGLALGAAHPDIIGGRLDQAVEHDIAGEPKNAGDAIALAPRHRLVAAIMAVAAQGDAGVGPVL